MRTVLKQISTQGIEVATHVHSAVRGVGLRSFAKSAAIISTGTIGAQLVSIMVVPFLTRIYGAASLGSFALYFSAISVLTPVICLRLDYAIPLPYGRRIARALLQAAILIATILSIVVALAIAIMVWRFDLDWLGETGRYAWLLALALPSAAGLLLINAWQIRERTFVIASVGRVLAAIASGSAQIVFGLAFGGALGLILGVTVGQWTSLAYLIFLAISHPTQRWSLLSVREMLRAVRRYRRFVTISAPAAVLDVLGVQIVPFAVTTMFGHAQAGLVFLAFRMVLLPMSLVTSALQRVMWSEVAGLQREDPGRLRKLFLAVTIGAFVITSPGLLLFAVGPDIFSFIFGPQWREAGAMSAFFFLSYWFGALAGSGTTLSTLGYNGYEALWIAFRLATTVLAIAICYLFHLQISSFLAILTIGWAFAYLLYFLANFAVLTHGARVVGNLALITK